jgi:NADH-quinone oxidoreductase subunit A
MYALIGVLLLALIAAAGAILLLTHLIGPHRSGRVKDAAYESGVDPIGDARRRFNVRFYILAMLFLLFDVEIVFFYPWASLFPRLSRPADEAQSAWATAMTEHGFSGGFMLIEMVIFIGILLVGYIYAWRKGAFRWN